jgi:hypothetical protein
VNTQEAVEEVEGLPASDLNALRERCKHDLYFLSLGILGQGVPEEAQAISVGVHGQLCRILEKDPKKRRLLLMPRGHLKSTVANIADSVRLALLDPDGCRILIASETVTLAEKFLQEIKGHFEKNKLLQALFPELIPQRFVGAGVQWSSSAATINRTTPHREATWSAIGVGGSIIGSHFTRIKCDDLIGYEAARSAPEMQRAKDWVAYIEPLLTSVRHDTIDFIGTRWSKNDLYAYVMEYYQDALRVYVRRAIENDQIILPQKYTWEDYQRIQQQNPAQWFAQFENNPLADINSDLPWNQVRRYRISVNGDAVLLDTPSGPKKWLIEELDRVLTADPNSGSLTAPDAAAVSVQGLSPDDELIQLESISGRFDPTDFVDLIFDRALRWKVRAAGVEKAGQQNTAHYLRRKIREQQQYINVVDLIPGKRKKDERIRFNLGPIIRNSSYYILPSQTVLSQQGADFPDCILWDELDAAAYGPDILRRPDKFDKPELQRREGLVKKLMARRSSRTGY